MHFIGGYLTDNFITLLLLIGFEFLYVINRKLPIRNISGLQQMILVVLMISLREYAISYDFGNNRIMLALMPVIKSMYWLGGQFYFLMCLVILPVKRKWALAVPQTVNIFVCMIMLILSYRSEQTMLLLNRYDFIQSFSLLVILSYLLQLSFYAVGLIRKSSLADGFVIMYIVGSSLLLVMFSKMDLDRGYLDEVASINVMLYFGYCAAVEQSRMQTRLFENKLELAQTKMSVLMAQIQPHFIFNSLMAIQAQSIEYPEVYDSIDSFSHYLRANFDSLGNTRPIPFERELENIKAYLALEALNYGDLLKVDYHLDVTDFSLPALSVEPLVENAVRHGAATFENGGTVDIKTKEDGEYIVVEVIDKGEGKRNLTEKQKKRRGIGIDNVRARLMASSAGRLEIHSEENGTRAILILNKMEVIE